MKLVFFGLVLSLYAFSPVAFADGCNEETANQCLSAVNECKDKEGLKKKVCYFLSKHPGKKICKEQCGITLAEAGVGEFAIAQARMQPSPKTACWEIDHGCAAKAEGLGPIAGLKVLRECFEGERTERARCLGRSKHQTKPTKSGDAPGTR